MRHDTRDHGTGRAARRWTATAGAVVAAVVLGVSPVRADDWLRVTSPNFVVYSDAGERDATRVARELEAVRSVFRSALVGVVTDSTRPLLVIALDDRDDVGRLLPSLADDRDVHGVFRGDTFEDVIVVTTERWGSERFQVVYHEYFHLVTRLTSGGLPPWLSEGLAEFYAALAVRGDTVELGDPRRDYLDYLTTQRLIPIEELVADTVGSHDLEGEAGARFYAQSWALTHYLMLGEASHEGSVRVQSYIDAVNAGSDALDAFEAVFGPADDVERGLSRYIRRPSFSGFRLQTPPGVAAGPYVAEALPEAEVLAVQAGVLARGLAPDAARRLIDDALRLDPELARAYEARGLMHLTLGESDPALEAFAEAVALGSDRYVPYYAAAVLGYAAGAAPDGTEALLRQAIERAPRYAPAHHLLASVLADTWPVPDEAVEHARQAAELDPSDVDHWVLWGGLLLARLDPEGARTVVETAGARLVAPDEQEALRQLRARTQDAGPMLAQAAQLFLARRLEEAEQAYRAATIMDPSDPDGFNGLARIHEEAGRDDAALAAYDAALAVDPSNQVAHTGRAELLAARGDLARATEALGRAAAVGAVDPSTSHQLGVRMLRRGDYAAAVTALEQSLAIDPDQPDARHSLGRALAGAGRPDDAVVAYRMSIAERPGYAPAHFNLGSALGALGDHAAAAEAYRAGLALNPGFARGHHGLGQALLGSGDLEGAVAAFRDALAEDRTHAPSYEGLASALEAQGRTAQAEQVREAAAAATR